MENSLTLCRLLLCLVVLVADKGDSVSGLNKLLGSEFGDRTEPFGDVTGSLRKLPPFEDTVEVHCPSGDILFGSQTTTSGKFSLFGLCELTLNVTVVVTVKLLLPCGVVGLDHLGGGGGGVLIESLLRLFLRLSTVLLAAVSILLSKFKVLGRVGFSPLIT